MRPTTIVGEPSISAQLIRGYATRSAFERGVLVTRGCNTGQTVGSHLELFMGEMHQALPPAPTPSHIHWKPFCITAKITGPCRLRVIHVIPAIPACPVRPKSRHSANARVYEYTQAFPPAHGASLSLGRVLMNRVRAERGFNLRCSGRSHPSPC
jgi:hypothetical protein